MIIHVLFFFTIAAFSLLVHLLLPGAVYGDGESWDQQGAYEHQELSTAPTGSPDEAGGAAEQGSAAQFDKRLPPVIPGERIERNGRTMRVWSSAGPVPVGKAPEPWDESSAAHPAENADSGKKMRGPPSNVGVIVDRRDSEE